MKIEVDLVYENHASVSLGDKVRREWVNLGFDEYEEGIVIFDKDSFMLRIEHPLSGDINKYGGIGRYVKDGVLEGYKKVAKLRYEGNDSHRRG